MPWARAADLSAASGGPTTLDQTIVKGSKLADGTLGPYYRLTFGAGEPHLPRTDLHPASYAPIHCAMSFVHFTDSHLVDAQSPGRVPRPLFRTAVRHAPLRRRVPSKYKAQWGYPDYPGLLTRAIRPFDARGVGLPWWQNVRQPRRLDAGKRASQ